MVASRTYRSTQVSELRRLFYFVIVLSLLSSFNDIHRMARFSVGTVPRPDLRGAQGAGPQGQTSHQLHPALHSVAVVHSRPGLVHRLILFAK